MKFTLKPKPPFDFDLLWKFYAWEKPSPEIYETGKWRRSLRLNEKLFPVKIESIGTTENPKLEIETFSKINKTEARKLKEKIEWIFNSQMDLRELYSFMERDKKLKALKEKLYGLKPANYASAFEGIVKTIIQQQISLIGSMHITSRLISEFGERVKIGKEHFYEFPSPQRLSSASFERLKQCGLSKQKTAYIKKLSKSVAEGDLNPEEVKKLPPSEGIEKLTQLKGVGRWTAELVIVTSTNHKEILPAGDLGVRRAISDFVSKDLMNEEDIRKFSKKWGKFKALIAYYLICNERSNKQKIIKKGARNSLFGS